MAELFKNVRISPEISYVGSIPPQVQLLKEVIIDECERQTIKDEAYQHGYIAGQAEAECHIAGEFNAIKQQLETALSAIPQAIATNRLQLNNEIAEIVLIITQQYFIEKESNPSALELQINHILKQLNTRQSVELCLHPQDIATLQKGQIKLDASHLHGLKIKSDDTLTLGGCIIKSEHGMFDASIEKQIDKLKELLLKMKQGGSHATLD